MTNKEEGIKRPNFSTRIDYFMAIICIVSLIFNFVLLFLLSHPDLLQTVRLSLKRVPKVTSEDHVRGASGVVAIEYADFLCPFCKELHGNLKALSSSQKLVWVFRNRPLAIHPLAAKAAVAAECAAQQGKFWEYADALFENQDQITSETALDVFARQLGLNQADFSRCQSSNVVALVRVQTEKAASLEIDATPTIFVNGKRYTGALPRGELSKVIAQ